MSRICPVCGSEYSEYPAISRRDNKTEICPECGRDEALEDFLKWIRESEDWYRVQEEYDNEKTVYA